MKAKVKIAIGLILVLLIGVGLIGCIQGMTPVWAKVKLDVETDMYQAMYANYCNGKIYYPDVKEIDRIIELDPLSGRERVIPLKWSEEESFPWAKTTRLQEIAVGEDGSIYCIVIASYSSDVERGWMVNKDYLCKFSEEGNLVYVTEVTEQVRSMETKGWSSVFMLETDTKGRVYLGHTYACFLYDEHGTYDKCINVNPERSLNDSMIYDIVPGRDGTIYVYGKENNIRLMQADYDTGTLVFEQDMLYGELFCFDAIDGIYVRTEESLYYYDTDLPVMGRVPEKLFDWWDLLIYKNNVTVIAAPKENCVLVSVASGLEESCGIFLIEKMPKWKALMGGYTYVEIP